MGDDGQLRGSWPSSSIAFNIDCRACFDDDENRVDEDGGRGSVF